MRRMAKLAAGIGAVMAMMIVPAHATTASGSYAVSATPFIGVSCTKCINGQSIGGYTFPANGSLPLSVAITDSSGQKVAFTVGQDLDGDGFSGNTDPSFGMIEPRVDGCGNVGDLSTSAVAFSPGVPTAVFVTSFDPLSCADGLAISGTITVTY